MNRYDPLGLTAYAVYRKLMIPEVGWTWYTGRLSGHVYLAFDSKNTGSKWITNLQAHGYYKAANYDSLIPRQYVDWITHSFHPWNVKTGDRTGMLVSVFYTEGSYVDINGYDADIRPIEKDDAILIPITNNEDEQIRLFDLAEQSAIINNKSMTSGDHGPYSFSKLNCANGAKRLVNMAGLKWPLGAYMWNGGVGVGGPMDWTLLPELTLRVAQGGYFVVTHYEGVGISSQAGGESGGIGLNISF